MCSKSESHAGAMIRNGGYLGYVNPDRELSDDGSYCEPPPPVRKIIANGGNGLAEPLIKANTILACSFAANLKARP